LTRTCWAQENFLRIEFGNSFRTKWKINSWKLPIENENCACWMKADENADWIVWKLWDITSIFPRSLWNEYSSSVNETWFILIDYKNT
jgi:hypothetical protein